MRHVAAQLAGQLDLSQWVCGDRASDSDYDHMAIASMIASLTRSAP
jgi:hypothetical protein